MSETGKTAAALKPGDRVRFVRTYRIGRDGAEFSPGERGTVRANETGEVVTVVCDLDDMPYRIPAKYLALVAGR